MGHPMPSRAQCAKRLALSALGTPAVVTVLGLALLTSTARPAQADEIAAAANQLLAAQALDVATTQTALAIPGHYERDPLARPFTHSDATAAVSAVVLNVILRVAVRALLPPGRAPHAAVTVLHVLTGIEGAVVINNFRDLGQ